MKLAVIGTGQMGQAMIRRIIQMEIVQPENIIIYDAYAKTMNDFAAATNTRPASSAQEAAAAADYVLLAVKPQVCPKVLADLAPILKKGQTLLSIAAGITLSQLSSWSGGQTALARIMPNLPAVLGQGVSAVCFSGTSAEQEDAVSRLLAACGLVFPVNEVQMDAVTGLSGSGPAYIMLIIEAMADGGVAEGLSREQAMQMAAMTVKGAAELVLEKGMHPAQIKDQVSSPGGTTIAALRSLEANGLRSAMIEAVAAASARSRQLREQAAKHD